MTSLDEALRALEKRWLASADEATALADRMAGQSVENELRRDAAQYKQCAWQLTALLTTRQEVAPVAEVGRDGSIIWLSLRMLKSGTKLYTSTGQTSDARDGE